LAFQPGARLGPYEIVRALGAGGMGEVYTARDTRLDRTVAIKVLNASLAADPHFRERFDREARAVSSLDHPHICALFDVGEHDGLAFLVMQYLEGDGLERRLAKGPLPLEQVLQYAVEIAEALDAAHRAGIVHRDLKPGNIMITKAGAKLLDFGLSKTPHALATHAVGLLPTVPANLTAQGTILGTPQYMAPEQLEGKDADPRTDLFAFGAVVYEMTTGRRAFEGATPASVIAAILEREPEPVSRLQPLTPPALEHLVMRCLRKDPEERWQTARDVVAQLKWIQQSAAAPPALDAGAAKSRPPNRRRRAIVVLFGALALGVGSFAAVAISQQWRTSTEPPPTEIPLQQLTANPPELPVYGAAISPDGKYLAYTDGNGLFLRLIATGEARPVPLPDYYRFWDVSWFPDGTRLLLTGESAPTDVRSLFSVATIGGTPRKLQDDAWRGAVAPDGSAIVFLRALYPIRDVWMMGAGGENPRRVVRGAADNTFWQVGWSPDARRIVYGRASGAGSELQPVIETRDRNGGGPTIVVSGRRLFQDWRGVLPFCWLADGRFVYALRDPAPNESRSNLWETRVDTDSGIAERRPPRRVTQFGSDNIRDVRATRDGRLTFLRERNQADVYVAPFDSAHPRLDAPRRLTLDDRDDLPESWTPDSKQIVFESRRATGSWDVFRQPVDAIAAEPLVIAPGADNVARVTPDGAWVLYRHDRRLMRVPLAGGPAELVLEGRGPIAVDCAPPPSARCVMSELTGTEFTLSEVHPLRGRGQELRRLATASPDFTRWRLSPVGNRIALVDFSDRVRVFDLAGGAPEDISVPSWTAIEFVAWAWDGQSVLATATSTHGPMLASTGLLHIDLHARTQVLRHEPNEWIVQPVAAPDGRSVAFGAMKLESNAWMLERF
jgi:eukaryotic-like serine/threonine-protein kinase